MDEKDYSLDGKDRDEWNRAWASMPHRRLISPPKIEVPRPGDVVKLTIAEDPPQFSDKLWKESETCPACGEATSRTRRLPASLNLWLANNAVIGYGIWIHQSCFESCPVENDASPIPW